jgi:hypothetical protein
LKNPNDRAKLIAAKLICIFEVELSDKKKQITRIFFRRDLPTAFALGELDWKNAREIVEAKLILSMLTEMGNDSKSVKKCKARVRAAFKGASAQHQPLRLNAVGLALFASTTSFTEESQAMMALSTRKSSNKLEDARRTVSEEAMYPAYLRRRLSEFFRFFNFYLCAFFICSYFLIFVLFNMFHHPNIHSTIIGKGREKEAASM